MIDITDLQAMRVAAVVSAASAAQPSAHQPLRTVVVKTAELARAAEECVHDKQHAKGKKVTHERLDLLFNTGTSEGVGCFQGGNTAGDSAGAAVIIGFGQVYGRKVVVYAQDFSVRGGILGTTEGEEICRLTDMAIDLRVSIVAIVDPGDARIQESVTTLAQYGCIFHKACEASGFVPQLSLILDPCAGGVVYCPALTDLVIMTREDSSMSVAGPDVVKASTSKTTSMVDLDGGEVHSRVSGTTHYLGEDESSAIDYARTVLAYLPLNSGSKPPVYAYAATCAEHEITKRLATIVPTNKRQPHDVLGVIHCIIDYNEFVQVQELFGVPTLTGFVCIGGKPVGIVVNQPSVLAGILDVNPSKKVARFVRPCDAFNLPVVTLVDVPGYKPGSDQKHVGIARRGAKVIYAYVNAQVPMVIVVLRKASDDAYIVMRSGTISADLDFAQPSPQVAMLGAASAVSIIHRHNLARVKTPGQSVDALRVKCIKEYETSTVNTNLLLEVGRVDGMIDPEQTREAIIESLATLATKRRVKHITKYHGNQPL